MLKFRCQHCGQRIAVPARHLGKLVTCAECGAQTHPLAEQIVKTKAAAPALAAQHVAEISPSQTSALPSTSACGNCGKPVGRLQASRLWEGEQVCGPCHHVLTAESSHGAARSGTMVAKRVHVPPLAPPAIVDGYVRTSLRLREQIVRGLVVFVVGVVTLYGALTLLRDLAGLIAVTAVAVLALVALYAIFRSRWVGRFRQPPASPEAVLLPARAR